MTAILDRPVLKHGSITSYTTHGCRCDACREALRVYTRDIRAARLARRTVRDGRPYALEDANGNLLPHGVPSTYQNWGGACQTR